MVQVYNWCVIWISLDKHIHYTLCLEAAQKFKFGDNDHPLRTYRFAKDSLAYLIVAENDAENGTGVEVEDE